MSRAEPALIRSADPAGDTADPGRVLHLLPFDLYRGGQVVAKTLRSGLDGRAGRHELLTLFDADDPRLRGEPSLAVPQGWPRRLGFDPRAWWHLRRHIAETRPAVVVAHGGESLKYAAFIKGRHKLVYHSFGVGSGRMRYASSRGFYRLLIRRCDAVVCISDAVARGITERRLAGGTAMSVIPFGRDPNRFDPTGPGSDPPRLAWVSSWDPGKNPEGFISLVERLRSGSVILDAVMAGEGPDRRRLTARAEGAGIEVTGPLDDIPGLLSSADIFAFTSTGRAEGLPGVLIEAGLAGLPTVTYDGPGARDIVLDHETGYVVGSFDEMVASVERLLSDVDLRTRLGAEARRHCATHFSLALTLDGWEALLASVRA